MKFAGLFGVLFFFTFSTLCAQDIKGIWRGYFYSGYGIYQQEFKYEVQINQLDGKRGPGGRKPIKGVTYSYRQKSFYGKARTVGIYDKEAKELTLKEDTLLEVKMDAQTFSCLMTCYLEYRKTGNKEVLEGTFSSVVTNNGKDCGSGTVYLERVLETDFVKEDFLLAKPTTKLPAPLKPKKDSTLTAKKTPQPLVKQPQKAAPVVKTPPPTVKQTTPKKPATPNNNTAKKPAEKPKQPAAPKVDSTVTIQPVQPPIAAVPPTQPPAVKRPLPPVPDIIKERQNPLVKTIVTNTEDIQIDLYDNGEIDGDTITVYHNNELVANHKGLTSKPISIKIKATADDPHHEFVMVANNLGSIPPNTALMIIRTGGKRYELFISSNEEKNAKVVIDFQPNQLNGK